MAARLPASQRTREELTAYELVKLATRLFVEEALEGETGDAVGPNYYEHAAQPGRGYRNGYRTGRLKTAEGLVENSAPQVAGRDELFRSTIREHLKGHTQGLEARIDPSAAATGFGRALARYRRAYGSSPRWRGPECRGLSRL